MVLMAFDARLAFSSFMLFHFSAPFSSFTHMQCSSFEVRRRRHACRRKHVRDDYGVRRAARRLFLSFSSMIPAHASSSFDAFLRKKIFTRESQRI